MDGRPPGRRNLFRIASPLGDLLVLMEGGRMVRIVLPGLGAGRLPVSVKGSISPSAPPPDLAAAFADWFRGLEGPLASVPRGAAGTPRQHGVWEVVRDIPRGQLRTYKEVALAAGFGPHGARAVGGALRANPLPLVVPCHRVLGKGLRLTGFGGSGPIGLELKRRLLEQEGIRCAPGCWRPSRPS